MNSPAPIRNPTRGRPSAAPSLIYPRLDAAGERHGVTGNLSRERPCLAGPRLAQLHLVAHLISQISYTVQCYAIQARQEQEMARCQNTKSVSLREIVFLGHHGGSPSFQSRAGPAVLPRWSLVVGPEN